ncbi:hypothetical protein [Saccharolobus islandicus]|uniref:Uncharacterized protein n=1 Tax=Saccharolobus islandicus (strain L.D.8.5 / Lassen \|nr:hypothetical protein [Sulfolobus islandicus]ADB87823.1 hypothetical protein LD85_2175 [Sulfolobus islandicus L.D.8.5]
MYRPRKHETLIQVTSLVLLFLAALFYVKFPEYFPVEIVIMILVLHLMEGK